MKCPDCDNGTLIAGPVENCSCHLHAPCGPCENPPLICDTCHECDHEWEYVDDSKGDGVWFESGGYEQCIKCGLCRDWEAYDD